MTQEDTHDRVISDIVQNGLVVTERILDQHVVIIGGSQPPRHTGDMSPAAIVESGSILTGHQDLNQGPGHPLSQLIVSGERGVPPGVMSKPLDPNSILFRMEAVIRNHSEGERLMQRGREFELTVDPFFARAANADLSHPHRKLFNLFGGGAERGSMQELRSTDPPPHQGDIAPRIKFKGAGNGEGLDTDQQRNHANRECAREDRLDHENDLAAENRANKNRPRGALSPDVPRPTVILPSIEPGSWNRLDPFHRAPRM